MVLQQCLSCNTLVSDNTDCIVLFFLPFKEFYYRNFCKLVFCRWKPHIGPHSYPGNNFFLKNKNVTNCYLQCFIDSTFAHFTLCLYLAGTQHAQCYVVCLQSPESSSRLATIEKEIVDATLRYVLTNYLCSKIGLYVWSVPNKLQSGTFRWIHDFSCADSASKLLEIVKLSNIFRR